MIDTRPLGQLIGQASLASQEIFTPILARNSLDFTEWVTLNLVATSPQAFDNDPLAAAVADLARIEVDAAAAALDSAMSRGMLTDEDGTVALTDSGKQLHRSMVADIAKVSQQVIGDIDPDDLATTKRVLAHYTERARAAAAG